MSDPAAIDGWTVAKGLWAILMSILGFFGIKMIRQVGEHDTEITRLKTIVLTKDDLLRLHQENQDRMDELRSSLVSTMNLAVERIEDSHRNSNAQVRDTQNLILKKLMERK